MNLRILKKLSKRAAQLLPLLGDNRKQFRAEKADSYTGLLIRDRACWERGRSVHGDTIRQLERKKPAADGSGWVWMAPPCHPLKGTVMVGAVSGYYEPEWDEQTAWEALQQIVYDRFTDYRCDAGDDDVIAILTRRLDSPSDIFRAARDLVEPRAADLAREAVAS